MQKRQRLTLIKPHKTCNQQLMQRPRRQQEPTRAPMLPMLLLVLL